MQRQPSTLLMWSLASAPLAWLVLFGLFILRARLTLGRWPAPYQPDPKDLGLDFHYGAVLLGMPTMLAAVLCVTGLALIQPTRRSRPVSAAALFGLALVIALARIDPGHVFVWLGD